jgi:hypothetical protein
MRYNIYLNSPQLAVNENKRKYYKRIIEENKQIRSVIHPKKYSPLYFRTAYNSIYYPNVIVSPF